MSMFFIHTLTSLRRDARLPISPLASVLVCSIVRKLYSVLVYSQKRVIVVMLLSFNYFHSVRVRCFSKIEIKIYDILRGLSTKKRSITLQFEHFSAAH